MKHSVFSALIFLIFYISYSYGIGKDPASCNYRGIRIENCCSCNLGYFGKNCTSSRKNFFFQIYFVKILF